MNITSFIPRDKLVSISVYRSAGQISGVGGHPVEVTPLVSEEIMAQVEKLSGGQAERAFGKKSSSTWRIKVGSEANVAQNDLIQPNSGPYSTETLEVEDVRTPDGQLKVLAVKNTERIVTLP